MLKMQFLIVTAFLLVSSPVAAEPIVKEKDVQTIALLDDSLFKLKASLFSSDSGGDALQTTCIGMITAPVYKISLADAEIALEVAARMEDERGVVISTVGASRILGNAITGIVSARQSIEMRREFCEDFKIYLKEKERITDQLSAAETALRSITSRIAIESISRGALRYR